MSSGTHKQHLIGTAQRRAFETYLRFGRVAEPRPADQQESKAIDPNARPVNKPTRFYVWRTASDDRVRAAHNLRNGQIFAWADPPLGGHPGSEPNCRCWAEPYFGDPALPDSLQPLTHTAEVPVTSTALWTHLESLRRPDGTLAESVITLSDGTEVRSRFWRTLVDRTVTLASGGKLRVVSEGGRQKVYQGESPVPLFQSVWTPKGPRITHTQRRLAFMGDLDTLLEPDFRTDIDDPFRDPEIPLFSANPMLGTADEVTFDLLGAAFIAVYLAQQAEPSSQGLGGDDKPVLTVGTWTSGGAMSWAPVRVDQLTAEQLRQSCEQLSNVQRWVDQTQQEFSRLDMSGQSARVVGSLFHHSAKEKFDAEKQVAPGLFAGLKAEISLTKAGALVSYGARDSTRLDFIEEIPPGAPHTVCDYEVKTGNAELKGDQLLRQAESLAVRYPNARIIMMEVRPR